MRHIQSPIHLSLEVTARGIYSMNNTFLCPAAYFHKLSFCVLPFKATSVEVTPTDKSYNYYNVAYSPLTSVKPPSYKYLTQNEIPQTTLS